MIQPWNYEYRTEKRQDRVMHVHGAQKHLGRIMPNLGTHTVNYSRLGRMYNMYRIWMCVYDFCNKYAQKQDPRGPTRHKVLLLVRHSLS